LIIINLYFKISRLYFNEYQKEILLKIKKIIINLLNIIIIIYITENYLFTQTLEKDFTGVDRIFMVSSIKEKECQRTKSHLI
jgi:hypothetical protein